MYTYLLVFSYTKNGNAYYSNKTVTLELAFSVDDLVFWENWASETNGQKSRLIGFYPIEPSRKPPSPIHRGY